MKAGLILFISMVVVQGCPEINLWQKMSSTIGKKTFKKRSLNARGLIGEAGYLETCPESARGLVVTK